MPAQALNNFLELCERLFYLIVSPLLFWVMGGWMVGGIETWPNLSALARVFAKKGELESKD